MPSPSSKNTVRQELLVRRRAIPSSKRLRKSRKILRKLFKHPRFLAAKKIAFYFDIAPEVQTRLCLKTLVKDKEIYLPRVNLNTRRLSLYRVQSIKNDLQRGAYSIMEPKATCPRRSVSRMEVIVVPGVGFDKKGNRMGRGAGYYDQLLRKAGKIFKIGLCFREQMVRQLPVTKTDVPVDCVITD